MADGPKFSLSLGSKKPDASLDKHHGRHGHANGTKRPHAALHESDDEDGPEGRHQEITHFDDSAGGALHSERQAAEKKPLVIPVGNNSRKRQKSGLPTQNTDAAEAAAAEAKAKAAPVAFGLNVPEQAQNSEDGDVEVATTQAVISETSIAKKTADEEALEALLGKKGTSNSVIPALSEEELFLRDYDKAPSAPTEADYDAVPIEEFGAAMLRGMGWKDGEAIGRNKGQVPIKQRTLERRPELLGIGAKPAKALGIELGEWGKHAKRHERKIDQAYAPVMLKNKKTGEMITEEEMQKRLKEQEMDFVDDEREESRHDSESRRDEKDQRHDSRRDRDRERERSRDKHRDRDRDRGDRSYHSSRRARSPSYDERRSQRRDKDDRERRERRQDKDYQRRKRSESEERYHSRREDRYRDKDRDSRYRDDERRHRTEQSHRERSDRSKH